MNGVLVTVHHGNLLMVLITDYFAFDITWKDVFCLACLSKCENLFRIDNILETICVFCFCALFSNIFPKIKFVAKYWSDL